MELTTPAPLTSSSLFELTALAYDTNRSTGFEVNASMNATTSGYSDFDMFLINNIYYFELFLYMLYSLIFVLGICGNTIVIYVLISSICVDRKYQFIQNNQTVAHLIATAIPKTQYKPPASPQPPPASRIGKMSIGEADCGSFVLDNGGENSMIAPLPVIAKIKPPQYTQKEARHSIVARSSSFLRKIVREKLTVTNLYLLNLAVCDFLYVLSIPICVCTIYFSRWQFNLAFCKIYFTQIYLCQCSIVFLLVVLSIDRYLSVKYPHKVTQFRSDKVARVTICASWILSFFVILPITIFSEMHYQTSEEDPTANKVPTCLIHW
jgi:hypothetical protein